jgi:Zn-dependent peptidase ImmA (M78 family)
MEASRLHARRQTPYDAPVDVLAIVRELGLVLMLQPLDGLLGFYVRADEVCGAVINSRIPESLQRFTLAHEIAHHVLGHDGSADDEHAVERFDPDSENEVAAQAFASTLLMPEPLVNRAIKALPATQDSRRLTSADAYLFSRQLGVSYSAGLWRLFGKGLLSFEDVKRFRRAGALAAKNDLRGDDRVTDARADVWLLGSENSGLSVLCRVGDEIRVDLPEDTSSGAGWLVQEPSIPSLFGPHDGSLHASDTEVALVEDEHQSAAPPSDDVWMLETGGADDRRHLIFVPNSAGSFHVQMEFARPWEPSVVMDQFALQLEVRGRQLAGQGLFEPSLEDWAERAALSA